MKQTISLLLLFLAFSVNADVQINQRDGFGHQPYSASDTDREVFVGDVLTASIQEGGAFSIRYDETRTLLVNELPSELAALEAGASVVISYLNVEEACSTVDVNGTERSAEKWRSQIRMETNLELEPTDPKYHNGVAVVRFKLWCSTE